MDINTLVILTLIVSALVASFVAIVMSTIAICKRKSGSKKGKPNNYLSKMEEFTKENYPSHDTYASPVEQSAYFSEKKDES